MLQIPQMSPASHHSRRSTRGGVVIRVIFLSWLILTPEQPVDGNGATTHHKQQ
jgi:hypothetical protein